MEKRKIYTSHSRLAELASERIVVGRLVSPAVAVRDDQRRAPSQPLAHRDHDGALGAPLREVGGERRR